MRKCSFGWPAGWPYVNGPHQRMLLIGLCIKTDDQGVLTLSRKELAAFSGASVATIDSCIATLVLTDCLLVMKADRDDMGSFGANTYALRLENPKVRTMFEFWGPVARRSQRLLHRDTSTAQKVRESRNSPATDSGAPHPETSSRPYKDSRTSSSSSSIFPSFPESVVIEDRILQSRVRQVWQVLGEGVDPDRIFDLARSLIIEIPKAIANGYDFDEEILPCLEEATGYFRSHLLWSFKVVFERELPVFRRQRLRRHG